MPYAEQSVASILKEHIIACRKNLGMNDSDKTLAGFLNDARKKTDIVEIYTILSELAECSEIFLSTFEKDDVFNSVDIILDIVNKNSDNGDLCEVCFATINHIIACEPRSELIEILKKHAIGNFDIDNFIRRTIKLLEEIQKYYD